jgi:hypothetical protein
MIDDSYIPPNDLASEKRLLGCCILAVESIDKAAAITEPKHFYCDMYAAIFSKLTAMRSAGELPDSAGDVANQLVILGELDRSEIGTEITGGLSSLIADLIEVPHTGHVEYYAGKIHEKWQVRTRAQKLESLARIARQSDATSDEITSKLDEISTLLTTTATRDNDLSVTARELDEAEIAREYLAPGILAARQFCLLAGPSKGCKTTLLCDIVLSLSSGAKILNEFYVTRAYRVGFISAESGEAVLQETLRRIAWSKPLKNLSDYENLRIDFRVWKLSEPGTIQRLIRWVKKHRLDVLVLDPFYLMAGLSEDASNMFVVGRLLAELQVVGNETGVTIIIAHHFKKLPSFDQYNAPELGMVAWSGFEQYTRQWLLLNRREAYDPDVGLHKLWLSSGGSAGHGGLFAIDALEGRLSDQGGRRWEVIVNKASEARQAERRDREEKKETAEQEKLARDIETVLATMERHPDGISKSMLRDESGVGGKIAKILPVILGDGRAVACRFAASNGQEYDGFKRGTRTPGQPLGQNTDSDCPTDTTHTHGQRPPYRGRVCPSGVSESVALDGGNEILSECPDFESVAGFGGRPA